MVSTANAMAYLSTQSIEIRQTPSDDDYSEIRKRPRRSSWSFRMKMGRETIWLTPVEYRVMDFLAARPYRAFTRTQIAAAAGSRRSPVSAQSIDPIIDSLRRKLGFFSDYIQTVPFIGYRFRE